MEQKRRSLSPILSGHSLMASRSKITPVRPASISIPTSTPASDALAKALRKTRFQVCRYDYLLPFMQACGLVTTISWPAAFAIREKKHDSQIPE